MACQVWASEPVDRDGEVMVHRTRRLLAAVNVKRELQMWICECATRALLREREQGQEPDPRSWRSVEVARRYANGEASEAEMTAAMNAAYDAGRYAGGAIVIAAARAAYAAYAAGWVGTGADGWVAADAAWAAANAANVVGKDAELAWQRRRFDELVTARLLAVVGEQAQ